MAADYLLEIDGIKGESKDGKLPDMIEIQSFSWGETNAGTFGAGTGGGAGKVSIQDLHCTTHVNKSSPLIALSCASGKHINKAVLHVRKQGGEQVEYYTVTLADILVSSYQSGGHSGGDALPTDQFSLNFAKIKFDYKPQDEKGKAGAAVTFGWDQVKNTKW
jgi:type VI secretion system secreted protein Hcp